MITKRKLTSWRSEALKRLEKRAKTLTEGTKPFEAIQPENVANERILILTQELIDQHLLAKTIK
jgi:hypothetical protein